MDQPRVVDMFAANHASPDEVPRVAAAVERGANRPLALAIIERSRVSHATLRKIRQNLCWAAGYNAIACPLTAGRSRSLLLSPKVAALAMSGSSAFAAVNTQLLKRTQFVGIRQAGSPQR